ncbi:protein-glutamate O-methyltransferase CheR [Stakelama sp. CBK3Z-3]|uniref:Protein-glutamate O-methyltransferase CheR n=1 Tax=Stakelama flava TaxID=2860338 RepID=A0ABS6XH00_9SPHN|nr:protein-glutamate O-methyltransferase CheR [Stakelama flava]MBW4329492.1 protein-glutamate O-methyltransferase CheR [Stakelama flava]
MIVSPATARPASGALSQGALGVIAAILEQRTGQQVGASRSWRIETALQPLLRLNDFASLDDLATAVVSNPDSPLTDTVIEAIVNHETSFFRDASILDQIVDAALTVRAENNGRRFRIWSAGCSTGQEPFSLAILLSERLAADDPAFPEIVATDISAMALRRAQAGRFSQFEIQRGLPVRRMISWFDSVDEEWIARSDLVRRVQFRRNNLANEAPPPGKFDLILCRNVLLYFSDELRSRVFAKLAGAMRDESLLVLGAGETVIGHTKALMPCQRFRGFYRRTPATARDAA